MCNEPMYEYKASNQALIDSLWWEVCAVWPPMLSSAHSSCFRPRSSLWQPAWPHPGHQSSSLFKTQPTTVKELLLPIFLFPRQARCYLWPGPSPLLSRLLPRPVTLKKINININMQSSIVANSHSNLQNVKIDDSGCILVLQQRNREIEEKTTVTSNSCLFSFC